MRELPVPPVYPNDLAQEIERRWQRRAAPALPVPRNDNAAGGGRCPACDKPGPIAPIGSQYRGAGLVHHHWLCKACRHEWVTAQAVNI
jgi:hypothetical protein